MICEGRILIADDEPMFLDTTAELLGYRGYECDCARDAPEAVELLNRQHYDLMISDIKMPGNPKLELIDSLKKIAKGMPVILVTAHPSLDSAIESIRLPVVAYLIKPVDFDELLSKVQGALKRSQAGRKAHEAQQHLAAWHQTLKEADALLRQAGQHCSSMSVDPSVAANMKDVADVVANFSRLAGEPTEDSSTQQQWALIGSAQLETTHSMLIEAIDVLGRTKHLFKSKQLGQLRRKLQLLVDTWPKQPGTPAR